MEDKNPSSGPTPVVMDIQPPQPRSFATTQPQNTNPFSPPSTPEEPAPSSSYGSGSMGSGPVVPPPTKAPKKKKPILAILVALIIVTGLAGFAVVYLKPKVMNDKAKDTTTQTTTPAEDADTGAEEAIKEVDDALASTNDSTDFAESDLSDSSLGL